jgi:hypothetical protein
VLCRAMLCCAVQCSAVQILPFTLISAVGFLHAVAKRRSEAVKGSSVCETCISEVCTSLHYSIIYYRCRTVRVRSAPHHSEQNQPTRPRNTIQP